MLEDGVIFYLKSTVELWAILKRYFLKLYKDYIAALESSKKNSNEIPLQLFYPLSSSSESCYANPFFFIHFSGDRHTILITKNACYLCTYLYAC